LRKLEKKKPNKKLKRKPKGKLSGLLNSQRKENHPPTVVTPTAATLIAAARPMTSLPQKPERIHPAVAVLTVVTHPAKTNPQNPQLPRLNPPNRKMNLQVRAIAQTVIAPPPKVTKQVNEKPLKLPKHPMQKNKEWTLMFLPLEIVEMVEMVPHLQFMWEI